MEARLTIDENREDNTLTMATFHFDGMLHAMKTILESTAYSDLTVSCGGQEFRVHRAVICPRSPFFAAACSGEFQASTKDRLYLMIMVIMMMTKGVGGTIS